MHGPNDGAAEPIKLMCLNHGNHQVKLHGTFNVQRAERTCDDRGASHRA
jgi:hypothetical protein